jgi:hypothetical protein
VLGPTNEAVGDLFWDDGEQLHLLQYLYVSYCAIYTATDATATNTANTGSITSVIETNTYPAAKLLTIQTTEVIGRSITAPSSVLVNGQSLAGSIDQFDNTTQFAFGCAMEITSLTLLLLLK